MFMIMTYIKCSKIFVFSSFGRQILDLDSGQSNYLASLMCFEVFFSYYFLPLPWALFLT